MSTEDIYLEKLTAVTQVERKRLMYGEWLSDECEECHSTECVTKFVDVSGKTKEPIYLCDTCFYAGLGPKPLREWMLSDRK